MHVLVFDMHTAAFLVGLLYLVLPAFTWAVLGEGRNRAAALWCAGGLAMGVGTILVSAFTGGLLPVFWLSLPVFLVTASYLVRIQSLRLDLGIPLTGNRLLIALFVSTLVFEGLRVAVGLYVPRAIYASLVYTVGSLLLAKYALDIARTQSSRAARWIALAYGGVAFAFCWRIVVLLQMDYARTDGSIVTDGSVSVVAAVLVLLSSVIGHFGYVGLALERAQRAAVQSAKEQARSEERQHLGSQIALLERQRSMGELTATIGHELKQPLTAILTNTQVVQRGLRSGRIKSDHVLTLLEKIEYNTQRASQILERIRNFMRVSNQQHAAVNMQQVVREVLELIEGEARLQAVRFDVKPVAGPTLVSGDAIQLSQIVLNLLRNAMESMAKQVQRRIQIDCHARDGRVLVLVRDWGTGLSEDVLRQAGSPFFSTKPQGLGMGLSISHGIARQHGGTLSLRNAEDDLGPGTIAVLNLPALLEHTQA